MLTVIVKETHKYRGFDIIRDQTYYVVYVQGKRKALWVDTSVDRCKSWINDLLSWMTN